jgi:hypothetical protein
MPLLKSLANDPTISSMAAPPANITAFIKNGENGIFPPSFPASCGSVYAGEVSSDLKDALEKSIRGTSSVADAFNDANAKIQACVDKAQVESGLLCVLNGCHVEKVHPAGSMQNMKTGGE